MLAFIKFIWWNLSHTVKNAFLGYHTHLMDAQRICFVFPCKRNIPGNILHFRGYWYGQGEFWSNDMHNECGACKGFAFTINLASDVHAKRNPTDFSLAYVDLPFLCLEAFLRDIPVVKIFKIHGLPKNIQPPLGGCGRPTAMVLLVYSFKCRCQEPHTGCFLKIDFTLLLFKKS